MSNFNPSNITTQMIQIFIAAAKSESFSAAASQLNISQPFVSKTIAALENEIEFPLFDRKNKRVFLNAAGRLLMERWEPVFQAYASAVDDAYQVHKEQKQSIAIVDDIETDKDLYLFSLIRNFNDMYPDIQVKIEPAAASEGLSFIENGIASIGFAIFGEMPALLPANISWMRLIEVPTIADVPPYFSNIYDKKLLTAKDLENIPIILMSSSYANNYNVDVRNFFKDSNIEPKIHSYASSLTSLFFYRNTVDAVVIGHPFLQMPTYREIRRITCQGRGTALCIYWDNKSSNPAVGQFVDTAKKYFEGIKYEDGAFVRNRG